MALTRKQHMPEKSQHMPGPFSIPIQYRACFVQVENVAGHGGAVYLEGNAVLSLSGDNIFRDNTARIGGGAVYLTHERPFLLPDACVPPTTTLPHLLMMMLAVGLQWLMMMGSSSFHPHLMQGLLTTLLTPFGWLKQTAMSSVVMWTALRGPLNSASPSLVMHADATLPLLRAPRPHVTAVVATGGIPTHVIA